MVVLTDNSVGSVLQRNCLDTTPGKKIMSPASVEKNLPTQSDRGRWMVVAAAVLWSTSGFFAKAPFFDSWPGPVLAFWRATFALLILLPLVRRPRWSMGLIPMACCFAAMNYTYLTAMVLGEASNAIWLQNTAPAWVFLISVFVFGESAGRSDWVLLAFAGLGLGLILFFELRGARPAAVVYGLLAGVFYAGVIVSLRQLREHDSAWLVTVNHAVTAVVLSPFAVQADRQGLWPEGMQWLFLAAFGILQMGVPYALFARGLRTIPSHEAVGIGLLEPLLLPIWVFLAWHHQPSYSAPRWWTLVGGGLIMLGLIYRYIGYFRRKEKPM